MGTIKNLLLITLLIFSSVITARADGYIKRSVDGDQVSYQMYDVDSGKHTASFFQEGRYNVFVWHDHSIYPKKVVIIFDDQRYTSSFSEKYTTKRGATYFQYEKDDLPTNVDFEHFGGGAIGFLLSNGETVIYEYVFEKEV